MARKQRSNETAEQLSTDDSSPTTGQKFSVDRRTYVKLGMTTAAGMAAIGSTAGTAAAESTAEISGGEAYDTIELSEGEQRVHDISDGETFENVLIDQTAPGSMFAIRVDQGANDWVIRNIGWKGLAPTGSHNRDYTFLIHARGDGVIENCFIDQRDHDGGEGSDVGGLWTYSGSHHGHIDCRHNFIAGCGNNASYSSGDGYEHNSATGTIRHYRSYHRDNSVSNFRPGIPGSLVEECVSVANDPAGARGPYPASGTKLCRAFWGWHHADLTMKNSAIWHDPDDVQAAAPFWATHRTNSAGDYCEVNIIDCDINGSWEDAGNVLVGHGGTSTRRVNIDGLGYNPDIAVLGDGVPTTAEMAAAGLRNLPPELGTAPSDGTGVFEELPEEPDPWSYDSAEGIHTDLPYELVIDHVEADGYVSYTVEFDGDIEIGEWEYNGSADGTVVTGGMGPNRGLDNIYFDGTIESLEVENESHARYFIADAQEREIIEEIIPEQFPEKADDSCITIVYDGVHETNSTETVDESDALLRQSGILGGIGTVGATGYLLFKRLNGGT